MFLMQENAGDRRETVFANRMKHSFDIFEAMF